MPYTNHISKQTLIEFLTTSFQNVRSSKRTDELHKVLLDEILNANPEWAEYDWKFEYQIPVDGFGGTFDVDIAGFSKGELKIAILAKAINSNVNKNIKNYANTTIGEAARIMFAPNIEMEKVLFVSILPRVAPRFNKAGEVQGFDDVVGAKNRTKVNEVLNAQYQGTVESMDIFFDIAAVRSFTHSDQFQEIAVENLDEMVCQ